MTGIPSNRTFFTAQELAGILGISNTRVHQLVAEGKLPEPEVRIGQRGAYSPEQVAQILARRPPSAKGEPWVTFAPQSDPNPAPPKPLPDFEPRSSRSGSTDSERSR